MRLESGGFEGVVASEISTHRAGVAEDEATTKRRDPARMRGRNQEAWPRPAVSTQAMMPASSLQLYRPPSHLPFPIHPPFALPRRSLPPTHLGISEPALPIFRALSDTRRPDPVADWPTTPRSPRDYEYCCSEAQSQITRAMSPRKSTLPAEVVRD